MRNEGQSTSAVIHTYIHTYICTYMASQVVYRLQKQQVIQNYHTVFRTLL